MPAGAARLCYNGDMSTIHDNYEEEAGTPSRSAFQRFFRAATRFFRPPPVVSAGAEGSRLARDTRDGGNPPDPSLPELSHEVWRREFEINSGPFRDLLPGLLAQGHGGKRAIMHNGELVEIIADRVAARERGRELFLAAGKPYTVAIIEEPVPLEERRCSYVSLD